MTNGILTQTVPAVKHEVHEARKSRLLAPFRAALDEFNSRTQWANGAMVNLFSGTLNGKPAELYLRNEGGRVTLNLTVRKTSRLQDVYRASFPIGYLNPERGWTLSVDATESRYLNWNTRTRRELA